MDYEVVIPTMIENRDDILTLESVPDGVTTHIERNGTLNEARNRGVRNVDAPIAVVMDDDISFSADTVRTLVAEVDASTLVGLQDYEFGLLKGRVMAFETSLWADIGGFDERLRSHNGDTDFCIRAVKSGYHVKRVADDYFHHAEHARSITTFDRVWRLVYLSLKHPRFGPLLFTGVVHHLVTGATLGNRVRDVVLLDK